MATPSIRRYSALSGNRPVAGHLSLASTKECNRETRVLPLALACFFTRALTGLGLIVAGLAPAVPTTAPGPARASALAKTVTIHRDTFGVPHVYGPTDASCVFGFIYAQAEDYFWQIEDSYLRSLGPGRRGLR